MAQSATTLPVFYHYLVLFMTDFSDCRQQIWFSQSSQACWYHARMKRKSCIYWTLLGFNQYWKTPFNMAGHAACHSSKHNGVAEVMWCSATANLSEWLTVKEMV
jgi:hypothetical protein